MKALKLEDFPSKTFDKIRYVDTDRQGHVNNSVFSSFLETGRVEILYNADLPILSEGLSFVIVSLKLEFFQEITWPGQVDIGTGIVKVGSSSITIYQGLFQKGNCVAQAETIIVQVDNDSRRSSPLSDSARQALAHWLIREIAAES
ncbi:MAG: acyl-CoA thioesterase [Chloroflexi bacterium]|nr:acyl-CoA thioesterase [Chloroflexota bacterium]MBK8931668.1 acyl-CoA thioesterase [Chloroflexota bacterium]MBP6805732.1 acyl-CoA thioesterase [Chloroflexota bacterium]MBP8003386.1 acyl-CoA thioesterase [Chloroflexota bacterium]